MSARTIIALLIMIGAFVAFHYDRKESSKMLCPADAYQCPDRSFVFRTGPQCQFAPCPEPVTNTLPKDSGVTPKTEFGTVKGVVSLSPACGVITDPPTTNCAFRGYQTTITFSGPNNLLYKTVSDVNGKYSLKVAKGVYKVEAKGGDIFPHCPVDTVTVQTNQIITKDIGCESGLR